MKKLLNKFYLNRFTFIISSVVAFVGFMVWGINYIIKSNYTKAMIAFIFAILILMLFIAYKKGQTNLQKMLLGGLLTYMVFDYLSSLINHLQMSYPASTITWILNSIFIIIVFISYMRQQMDHKGASISTVVSQCCGIMMVGAFLHQLYNAYYMISTLPTVLWWISISATYIYIIAMCTRINEYKKIRTAKKAEGNWTEEERKKAKKIFSI